MKNILEYKPIEDTNYAEISDKDLFLINADGKFDGLTAKGYETFLNLVRFLNTSQIPTGWKRYAQLVFLQGEEFDKTELFKVLEQNIYWLIELVFYDKARIRHVEYQLTPEILELMESNVEKYINVSQKPPVEVYSDSDYLFFVAACIVLKINDIEKIQAGIRSWKNLFTSKAGMNAES